MAFIMPWVRNRFSSSLMKPAVVTLHYCFTALTTFNQSSLKTQLKQPIGTSFLWTMYVQKKNRNPKYSTPKLGLEIQTICRGSWEWCTIARNVWKNSINMPISCNWINIQFLKISCTGFNCIKKITYKYILSLSKLWQKLHTFKQKYDTAQTQKSFHIT